MAGVIKTLQTTSGIVVAATGGLAAYADIQAVTDSRLLGRSAGSNGSMQEITVGTGLSLSGGSLTASGGGTVTSVGLSMPTDIFDVASSPVTSSGTLTVTLDDQAANKVWAGPTTGADAAPAFRSLVAADLPTVTVAKGGTNKTSWTAGSVAFAGSGGTSLTEDNTGLFYADSTNRLGLGTATPSFVVDAVTAVGSSAQTYLSLTDAAAQITGALFTGPDATLVVGAQATGFTDGPGGIIDVVTNDPLYLKTNDLTRMTIAAGGNVGIGTSSPTAKVDMLNLVRVKGVAASDLVSPSSGKGVEIWYDTTNSLGAVQSYDRDAAAYKELDLKCSDLKVLATGEVYITGQASSSPGVIECRSSDGTSRLLSLWSGVDSTSDNPAIFFKGSNTALRFGSVTGVGAAGFSEELRITTGQVHHKNSTSNCVMYGNAGVAAPGNGSVGEKIQLYGTMGTVGSSDYAIGIESNTLWFNSGSAFKWYRNSGLAMTLDGNGELIIDPGATPSQSQLSCQANGTGALELFCSSADNAQILIDCKWGGSSLVATHAKCARVIKNAGKFYLQTATGQSVGSAVSAFSDAIVVDCATNFVGVGTASPAQNFHATASTNSYMAQIANTQNANVTTNHTLIVTGGSNNPASWAGANFISFRQPDGTERGSIAQTTTGIAVNLSSDERLKTNIRDCDTNRDLSAVQVRSFEWKDTGITDYGFVAQELVDVMPEAVRRGGEDEKTEPWGVDYARFTPLLVKAVQQLAARVAALEN